MTDSRTSSAAESRAPGPEHAAICAAQMGRPLQGSSTVAARCELDLPVVLEVHPEREGAPFPTLYYLTCPLARTRISRLEAEGGVKAFTQRVREDPTFREALQASHTAYARARAAKLPPGHPLLSRLRGGVGGARGDGVKCLHAHYAHHMGGGPNPVGAEVAKRVGPLACERPCVRDGARNPAWREPPP